MSIHVISSRPLSSKEAIFLPKLTLTYLLVIGCCFSANAVHAQDTSLNTIPSSIASESIEATQTTSVLAEQKELKQVAYLGSGIGGGKSSAAAQEPKQVAFLENGTSSAVNMEKSYNTAFLHGIAPSTIDIKSFLVSKVLPGIYRVDLYVNTLPVGRYDIVFSENYETGSVEPCFSVELLGLMDINTKAKELQKNLEGSSTAACLRLPELIPQSSVSYDENRLQLNVTVPQVFMSSTRRGYIDPSLWSNGVPVAFVNYYANMRRTNHSIGGNQTYSSVGLQAGANLGAWRLRNNSSYTTGTNQSSQLTSQNTYLQRDVVPLKSQLWLGETYTLSPFFDNVRFLGAQIASDEAMRPDNERGYAPTIQGVANSNATVEVRQDGYLIYTTQVAAGPFRITDLAPSGTNGDLEITVIEANGERRTTRQAFSAAPLMVREGRVVYDLTMGKLDLSNHSSTDKPVFLSSSALYGIGNNVTISGGLQVASGYQAYAAGIGLNTMAGAVSLSALHTRSDHQQPGRDQSGQRLQLRYAKFFESTKTNVTASVQRNLSGDYQNLASYAYQKKAGVSNAIDEQWGMQSTSRFNISVSQPLGRDSRLGNFYLNASTENYKNASSARSVSLGYSNNIGSLTYNIGYTHARGAVLTGGYDRPRSDNIISLTFSFPLGKEPKAPRAYTVLNRQNSQTSIQTGVSGSMPFNEDIYYSVAGGRDYNGKGSGSAAISATTSMGRVGATYSYSNNTHSTGLSASGSIVAHAGGINLSQSLGETFMLAKVEPAQEGVAIRNYAGISTGRNGYAVIPNAVPYRANQVGLSTQDLSADIEFENAIEQVIPNRGAAVLATFKAQTGKRIQFEIKQADGQPIPFGATLLTPEGEQLGMADPRGRVLVMLEGDQVSGQLLARWDNLECRLQYSLSEKSEGENYQRVPLVCSETMPARNSLTPTDRLQGTVASAFAY